MKRTLSALICAVVSLAAVAASAGERIYVNGSVRGTLTNYYDIQEYATRVSLRVNASGSNFYFSGQPCSGSLWRSGNWLSISGGSVSGNANRWGDNFSVRVTVRDPKGGTRAIDFTLYSQGPMDDPQFPPSFWVSSGDANLNLRPTFGDRNYSLSGSVDKERCGAEGIAVVGLLTAAIIDQRPREGQPIPKSEWLEQSPVFRPAFP